MRKLIIPTFLVASMLLSNVAYSASVTVVAGQNFESDAFVDAFH